MSRLINGRPAEAYLTAADLNHQIAAWIDPQRRCRLRLVGLAKPRCGSARLQAGICRAKAWPYSQRDGVRVGARLDHKVVLQLALVGVIDQVDAGIHARVLHLGISRHIGMPFLGIVAENVVRLSGQLLKPCHPGRSVRARQFHVEDVRCPWSVVRWFLQLTTDN